MSYDISSLGVLAEPADIQPDEYQAPASNDFEAIPKGTYLTKVIDGNFQDRSSGSKHMFRLSPVQSKKAGKAYMGVEFAVEIVDGTYAGRRLYGRVNCIPEKYIFNEVEKGREEANSFADLIVATKYPAAVSSNDEYAAALEWAIDKGVVIKTLTDWEVYSNPNSTEYAGTGERVKGMKNFPLNQDGTHATSITLKDALGKEYSLPAKNVIKRVYPTKS